MVRKSLLAFPTHYPTHILEQATIAGALVPGRVDADAQGVATEVSRRLDAVAVEFGVSREQIVGPSRKAAIAAVRHTAMLRCHLAGASYPLIGSMFARDHTSVIQAVRKVSGDPRYAAKQAKLRAWYAAKKAMSNGAA